MIQELITFLRNGGVRTKSKPVDDKVSVYLTGSLTKKEEVKSSEGIVTKAAGFLDSGASSKTFWFQLWDGDPSGSGTLQWRTPIKHKNGKDSIFSVDFSPDGLELFSSSIWVSISQDRNGYNALSSNYASFRVIYE